MADGDIVHANLQRRYWAPYKQVCLPNDFNAEAAAHDLALPLKKTIGDYGDTPINFICDCIANYLDPLLHQPLLNQGVDYGQISRRIDTLSQKYPGGPRAMELARKSLKQQVGDVRHGQGSLDAEVAVQNYFMRIHDAQFAQRVPLTNQHLNGLDHATVTERLSAMRPHVAKELGAYAKEAIDNHSVEKLRRRRYKQPTKDLYEAAY